MFAKIVEAAVLDYTYSFQKIKKKKKKKTERGKMSATWVEVSSSNLVLVASHLFRSANFSIARRISYGRVIYTRIDRR